MVCLSRGGGQVFNNQLTYSRTTHFLGEFIKCYAACSANRRVRVFKPQAVLRSYVSVDDIHVFNLHAFNLHDPYVDLWLRVGVQ